MKMCQICDKLLGEHSFCYALNKYFYLIERGYENFKFLQGFVSFLYLPGVSSYLWTNIYSVLLSNISNIFIIHNLVISCINFCLLLSCLATSGYIHSGHNNE